MAKAGRPPKSGGKKMTAGVRTTFTAGEHDRLQKIARLRDRTVANLIHAIVREALLRDGEAWSEVEKNPEKDGGFA